MYVTDELKQFEKEENFVLENFFYKSIYPRFKKGTSPMKSLGLEFFITSNCNKKCTYCYLHKNEDKLCPPEARKPKNIIANLELVLNHFSNYNNGQYEKLDLFSGEIWDTKLGLDVLNTILNFEKQNKINFASIIIPSNCSFLLNETSEKNIRNCIEEFKNCNTRLVFSCSVDGLVIDNETRPFSFNKSINLEEFYSKLFKFCTDYTFCFHPMVDAFTIEKWEENLNWWIKICDENNYDFLCRTMFLEVRNANSWTDEKIVFYLKFLKKYVEFIYQKYFNNDIAFFVKDSLNILNSKRSIFSNTGSYIPWDIRETYRASCSTTQNFSIRLGDLQICPCHRLAYPKLNYGQYIVQDNQIVGIKANNIPMAVNHYITGYNGYLKCDSCVFSNLCVKGCQGAQYEYSKEFLYPIESVCELEKAKCLFTIINLKVLAKKLNNKEIEYMQGIARLNLLLKKIKAEEKEVYEKWNPIIENLLLEI